MDVRTRLRKLVNRGGHLGSTRLFLLRLIDPIEWYVRRNDPQEQHRPLRRRAGGLAGSTSYAPLRVSTSRQAEQSFARMAPQHSFDDSDHENYLRKLGELRREHAVLLEGKAREVLSGTPTTIETTAGTVGAKLVRFRNGAVIDHWYRSSSSSGRGQMRVERLQFSDLLALTIDNLVQTIVSLGPDAHPVAEGGP
jgi:hypothetical protein